MLVHDFERYPELSNAQLEVLGLTSPHQQIINDFDAVCVEVVDGDTIRVSTDFRDFVFPVRLGNIDAPELSEGGDEAREWLATEIEGQEVRILMDQDNRVDKYGRLLGRVFHNGLDLGEAMLHLGLVFLFGTKNESLPPPIESIVDEGGL